jgi:hypothetical protein
VITIVIIIIIIIIFFDEVGLAYLKRCYIYMCDMVIAMELYPGIALTMEGAQPQSAIIYPLSLHLDASSFD